MFLKKAFLILVAAGLILATTQPSLAGGNWHHHGGHRHGGISPGAAIGMGLGALALGAIISVAVSPPPQYYYYPPQPRGWVQQEVVVGYDIYHQPIVRWRWVPVY